MKTGTTLTVIAYLAAFGVIGTYSVLHKRSNTHEYREIRMFVVTLNDGARQSDATQKHVGSEITQSDEKGMSRAEDTKRPIHQDAHPEIRPLTVGYSETPVIEATLLARGSIRTLSHSNIIPEPLVEPKSRIPESEKDLGDKDSVTEIQSLLASGGYYRGKIDGIAGPRTLTAIEAFKKANGVPLTGRINADLIEALQNSLRLRVLVDRSQIGAPLKLN